MPFDKTTAARLADFIQFAYSMFSNPGPDPLRPAPPAGLDQAGYSLTFWLNAKDFEDTSFYGYIAQSKTNPGDVILAVRGTENPAEWLLDFATLPVFFHADASVGSVALGFQSIEQTFTFVDKDGVKSSLADAFFRISAQNTITSVTILGHSLGAALATLAAAELAVRNTAGVKKLITVYTYASPRVGLLDFAAWFNSNISTCYRIWNVLDIVPEVPTFPYIHVSVFGERLFQSPEQLGMLQKTPQCEHNLRSYQWLLDPGAFSLNNGCSTATGTPEAPISAAHIEGAVAMHRAATGRI